MEKFAHLHVHTEYSLLDGAARIKKLIKTVYGYGMPAVAMTDHGNMYGAYKFLKAIGAKNEEIESFNKLPENADKQKPFLKGIVGTEFYVATDLHFKEGKQDLAHLILLAKNKAGYKNLVKLNSIAYVEGFYYKPRIDYDLLSKYSEGLICLTACIAGDIPKLILARRYDEAEALALRLKGMFGEDFYLEVQNHHLPEELEVRTKFREMGKKLGIKLVATNDAHYIYREDAETQDVLMCIQMIKKIDDPSRMKFNSDDYYIKTRKEMEEVLGGFEDALDNTLEIVDKCEQISIKKENMIPSYTPPDGKTPQEYLTELTREGIKARYKDLTPEITERMNYELGLINKMGFNEYFLIVWDFVHYAKSIGINVGPGRGSGAGSIVAYAIGITEVEPLKYALLFERFINPDRVSMPDFDIDFPPDRVDEVIDYVTQKYGVEKVCGIVTFGTLKSKAAIKDVARVFNMSFNESNKLTKNIDVKSIVDDDKLKFVFKLADPDKKIDNPEFQRVYHEDLKHFNPELTEMYKSDPQVKKIVDIAIKLENMPRNCSKHAAGVVICAKKLDDNIPLTKVNDDVVTQYDKVEVEKLGYLKMDFLRLTTLSDIQGTLEILQEETGKKPDLYSIGVDDPKVYELISSGDTEAIFQLESGGFKKFMKELRPTCLEDIIAGVSLYRPGPMDFIPDYIKNKNNPDKIVYALPCLKKILEATYGVIVYQEQVMQIVQEMAGYSLGQADIVRRMMSKKEVSAMIKEREVFINGRPASDKQTAIDGALKRGATVEIANEVFDHMISFASYAFNKSHAAAYAFVTYQTAWLKLYHQTEYLVGTLNNRLNKPNDITKYITYAKSKNIPILPPNINRSMSKFSVEDGGIRFGIGALKNLGFGLAEKIIEERKLNGDYFDIRDLISRLNKYSLNKKGIESLILSGALDCFGHTRTDLMNVYENVVDIVNHDKKALCSGQMSLFDTLLKDDSKLSQINYPNKPEYPTNIKLKMEKEIVGVYVSGHPLDRYLDKLKECNFSAQDVLDNDTSGSDEDMPDIPLILSDDEEENESTLKDGQPVVFGGVICEVVKKFTRADNKEMAIIKVEDLYGNIEVLAFPKSYQKNKDKLEVDRLGTFKGKILFREGETPKVSLDSVDLWQVDNNQDLEENNKRNYDFTFEEIPKKLYLRFDTTNEKLQNAVIDVLSNHMGIDKVIIKCSKTNRVFSLLEIPVNANNLLVYELCGLIGDENIKIVEK